jgi:two-component system response regulator LytT
MMLSCIAIDDEPFALSALADYCCKVPFLSVIALFNDPYKAIIFLKQYKPDLIFLDIQMPGISGIQIAESFDYHPMIIFTTAHNNYAVDGFNLNALDYLLKPFDFERFYKAVAKAKEKFEIQNQYKSIQIANKFIIIKIEYKNVKIYLPDILFIEAIDNYSKIHTYQKKYLTHQNLKNISSLLPENEFIRVHKSFIIHIPKIIHFTNKNVVVGEKTLPVGRTFAHKFLFRMKLP